MNARIVALLLLLVLPLSAERLFDYGDPEPASAGPGVIAAEAGAGLLGTVLVGVGLAAATIAVTGEPADSGASHTPYAVIAAVGIGAPLGAGAATWLAGNAMRQEGRFGSALVGAYAGLPVAAGIFYLSTLAKSDPLMVIAALAPAAGAVIGYNLSRPCHCIYGAVRVLPPYATARTALTGRGERSTTVTLNLLSLRI
jgi:hypothetical protein